MGPTDIAVAYEVTGQNAGIPGVVTILDTHASFDASKNDWPLTFQNGRNSAVLLRTSPSSLAVSLTAGLNPSVFGDNLVFTATLTPGTGNGAVQFLDGTTPISGSIPLSNGSASFSTSDLGPGAHSITARYTGNNHWGLRKPYAGANRKQTQHKRRREPDGWGESCPGGRCSHLYGKRDARFCHGDCRFL